MNNMRASFEANVLSNYADPDITGNGDGGYLDPTVDDHWSTWQTAFQAAYNMQQAVIDRLMLEFCPDEMTEEQIAEWAKHQKKAPQGHQDQPDYKKHARKYIEECKEKK